MADFTNIPPRPRKVRINIKTGKKEVHVFTDDEILEFFHTGKVEIKDDAKWEEVE